MQMAAALCAQTHWCGQQSITAVHHNDPHRWLGGTDDTGVEYMQMAAEKLDLPDASMDIVGGAWRETGCDPGMKCDGGG